MAAKDYAHITNGRDHDGTEYTLCGLKVDWDSEDTMRAVHADKWCPTCQNLDA